MAKPKEVVITMEGGVIQHIKVPPGVVVKVMDFDPDEVDASDPEDRKFNDRGEGYVEAIWGPGTGGR